MSYLPPGEKERLLALLEADAWNFRLHAAQELGKVVQADEQIIKALNVAASSDPVTQVAEAAQRALSSLQESGGLPAPSGQPLETDSEQLAQLIVLQKAQNAALAEMRGRVGCIFAFVVLLTIVVGLGALSAALASVRF
jgi:hypothetical protein